MYSPLESSFNFTVAEEGGFFDDPVGGPTMYGVSLKAHRADIGDRDGDGDIDADDVRLLPLDVAQELYRDVYWGAVQGDAWPAGVGLMLADMAYHHGAKRAIQYMQLALGDLGFDPGPADGIIGSGTRKAVRLALAKDPTEFIGRCMIVRLRYMMLMKNWEPNKNGWSARCIRCAVRATEDYHMGPS